MGNVFLNGLVDATNYGLTENGAVKHLSTRNLLLDMFALGGAYRTRSDADVILLFKNALETDETYALKCLFYLRDARGGQGERRFFRVCMRWLATERPEAAKRNMNLISEYGRWDDLYCFIDTPLQEDALEIIKNQLVIDLESVKQDNTAVSLLGKWLKSCNTSSKESRYLGNITREYLGLTQKQYRQTLSLLRTRINIVEKLMSENRWDEIEFDKIPSKAGLIYKNAFARRDIIKEKYAQFAKDTTTKVNAGTLYPYEVVQKATTQMFIHEGFHGSDVDRAMVNKYWDNLKDYLEGGEFNGLAVVDTSGSMRGTPLDVAISLGMYCAEKANGPFHGHYISFASRPQLIKVEGVDFVDKVYRIYKTNLIDNTNIKAVFKLLLDTAIENKCKQEDLPQNILIISDMEFDCGTCMYGYSENKISTLMEDIAKEWELHGYKLPHLIYWNVNARTNNIAQLGNGPISFVSGMSPSIFQTIMSGKTGVDLMYETLNAERYNAIK